MKTLSLRLAACGLSMTVTLMLSYAVAKAECADLVIGQGWSCTLTNQCGGWCYYDCECHGISQQECDRRLDEAGFETVEGPQC